MLTLVEFASWQVCATEGKCNRWFVHDYDEGGGVSPISFTTTTLEALQVHPLSATACAHSSAARKFGYFEVEMVGKGSIGLGTAREHFASQAHAHIGWEDASVGYHSIDGSKWISDSTQPPPLDVFTGKPYAAPFGGDACEPYSDFLRPGTGEGDFVGCGVDFETCEVFFTLNGQMQGVAFTGVEL